MNLPVVHSNSIQACIIVEVEDFSAWTFRFVALKERHEVITIEMDFERVISRFVTFLQSLLDVGNTCRRHKGR